MHFSHKYRRKKNQNKSKKNENDMPVSKIRTKRNSRKKNLYI